MMRSKQTGFHMILPISQKGDKGSLLDHPHFTPTPISQTPLPEGPSPPSAPLRLSSEHAEMVLMLRLWLC